MDLNEILSSVYTSNDLNIMRLDRVDIVSPYISEGFFEQMLKYKPVEVSLVVDAGCSADEIKNVIKLLDDKLVNVTVRLGKSTGLVHSKLFLFHWSNCPNSVDNCLLLWGSCNATEGGFGRNAEIFSWAKLSDIDCKKNILNYFDELSSADCANGRILDINKTVSLSFPKVRLDNYCEMPEIDSLDLWLQKGKLCHKYPPDTNFKFIKIKLKQPLQQIADTVNDTLKTNGFDITELTTTISYNYLRDESFIDVLEENPKQFRALYFIETVYGKWTSQSCYDELKGQFYSKDRGLRRQHVEKISSANPIDRTEWEDSFIKRLKQIVSKIDNPELYFQMDDHELDEESYRVKAKDQMTKDLLKMGNEWFKQFYIDGLEFIELPPLREFKANWDEFTLSFCSALAFEINEKDTKNRIAIILRDNFDCYKNIYDEKLYKLLKADWEKIKDVIIRFYLNSTCESESITNNWAPLIEFSKNRNLRRNLWQLWQQG